MSKLSEHFKYALRDCRTYDRGYATRRVLEILSWAKDLLSEDEYNLTEEYGLNILDKKKKK